MKKILFFASALAGLFLTASCQQESLEPEVSGNVVSYTIQVPGILSTKAIGENVSAVNELVYEVYRTEATAADDHSQTETKLFSKTAVITNGTATVDFELVNNQNFRVLFWAHVNTETTPSVYTTTDLKNVTLSQSLTANAESYAAFAGSDFIKYGDNIKGRTVTLVRPIAQLNIATAPGSLDIEGQTTVKMTTTGVTVTGLSTLYNVAESLAGEVSTTAFTYSPAAVSGLSEQKLSVNGTAYDYVAMNYVGFAEQSGSNVEVSYTINTENVGTISNTIKNVPVKANYRTNIVGNLITSMSDYTITLDKEWANADITYACDASAAQAALDNAAHGTIIKLHPGVNYGTLYLRPVEGSVNTVTDCDYLVYRNEMLRKVEDLTIQGAPGATIDAIKVVSGFIEGSTGYVVDIKNLVIDSVTFTDDCTNAPHSYSSPLFFDLTYINVDGLTVKNSQLIGDNDKMNFVYFYGSGKPANSTFETAAKNIIIEGNVVEGITRLCELRQTNNVTITGNTIKNTAQHGMLLAADKGTYSGKVTITGNTADGIRERFVRMAGAGDAEVVITDNTINNYLGADADYIKVTDGNNVTVENNTMSRGAYDAASLQAAIVNGGQIELINDITVDKWIMFSEDYTLINQIITLDRIDVTINGNGHTLTVNGIESGSNGNQLFQGASNLNIHDLTIKYADGLAGGGIGLDSGNIRKVNFVGGDVAIFPGEGEINIEECSFATNATAIYFEQERDNLTVTGCTFTQPDDVNVILLRGDVKFTDNIVNSGRTVNIVSGSPVVTGNNFNNVRLKVYAAATATVSGNIINNLVFESDTYASIFTDNTITSTVTVPDNNTEDVVLSTGIIKVTVQSEVTTAGDQYKIVVSNESTQTDNATGETTVAFDAIMYKNDVKVSGDVIYEVTINIGTDKIISTVTHNGASLTKADTGADQTYTYSSATGVLTIYTKSFSPFAVTYRELTFESTFADNSWENIILACQKNKVPASWNVGDKKEMTIGGSTYDIAIIGKNHDAYSGGSGKAPLTFQLLEVYGTAAMNATQTNETGWSGSKMRTATMVEILSAMPSEVRNAIKAVDKETLKGTRDELETTSDKLFLLSEIEVNGSVFYSNNFAEGSQYAYYLNGGSKIMNSTWWLRGPGKSNAIGYTQINMSGYMANGSAETAVGVVFGFCF